MYIGGIDSDPTARKVHTRQSVIDLWANARKSLESLGATVYEVDFPVVTQFESPDGARTDSPVQQSIAPPHHNEIDMCQLMAYAWDDFLAVNGDKNVATSLAQVESATIFPRPLNSVPDKYDSNDPLVRHTDVVAHITDGRISTYNIPNLGPALQNLEAKRKSTYEDWMTSLGLDCVVWPCNGDVGKADADVNETSAAEAWRNGVLYSNGNCAIRQLGIPTVSVPMGVMSDIKMPVNITFAGKAYEDNDLFRYAYAFEKGSNLRQAPARTPPLASDTFALNGTKKRLGLQAPKLTAKGIVSTSDGTRKLHVSGTYEGDELVSLHVYIDGDEVEDIELLDGNWQVQSEARSAWNGRTGEKGVPDPEFSMVIVLAIGKNGKTIVHLSHVGTTCFHTFRSDYRVTFVGDVIPCMSLQYCSRMTSVAFFILATSMLRIAAGSVRSYSPLWTRL
jgi:amidase